MDRIHLDVSCRDDEPFRTVAELVLAQDTCQGRPQRIRIVDGSYQLAWAAPPPPPPCRRENRFNQRFEMRDDLARGKARPKRKRDDAASRRASDEVKRIAYAHAKVLFQTRKNVSSKQCFCAPSVEREYLEAIRRQSRCFAYTLRVVLRGGFVGIPRRHSSVGPRREFRTNTHVIIILCRTYIQQEKLNIEL
jgi:hypothetical protein